MPSPCAACTRGCCRKYTVTVTGYDVWTLARGLRLAPEQFLYAIRQREPGPRGFALDAGPDRFDIALAKTPGEGEQPCAFWLELPSGGGRCGVYALRPYVCQTYPATISAGAVVRRGDVLCPDDAWRDGALEAPIWAERVRRMYVELDVYELMVAHWNWRAPASHAAGNLSLTLFYAYLMAFYRQLEQLRAGAGERDWGAMAVEWHACRARSLSPLARPLPEMQPWFELLAAIHAIPAGILGPLAESAAAA